MKSKKEIIKYLPIPTFNVLLLSHTDYNNKNTIIGKLTEEQYNKIYELKHRGQYTINLFNMKLSLYNFKVVTKKENYKLLKEKDIRNLFNFDTNKETLYSIPTELNFETGIVKCYDFGHKVTDCFNSYEILKYKLTQLGNPDYFIIFNINSENLKSLLNYNHYETTTNNTIENKDN